ncbi:long-chain fatty acid--CoA ligase [Deinococcus detaillensis]|uniref:Long-chain fatty acid--CoA ligase n=1 Tax=Deinococcus detaillensis TaxID=2592048 RepID=A0A553UQV4_9DEIO|nr:long-chain fatty acid--CoA ligase [Deinococcus detaillensis]TSA82593.1 long-chain fatty acid--CoA ligase [Deinococcus detaillensis]
MNKPWLKHYQNGVPHEFAGEALTLPQLLERASERFGKEPALEFLGHRQAYRQLWANVQHFASGLQALGVQKGDRVAIMLPNTPQFVVAFFGAALAGAVVVNTSPLYVAHELEHQLIDSGASVLVMLDSFYPRFAEIENNPALSVRRVIVTGIQDALPFPKNLLYPLLEKRKGTWVDVKEQGKVLTFGHLLEQAQDHPVAPRSVPIGVDDVALLQYTGGTTGVPKGAMLTHRNLVANAQQAAAWMPDLRDGQEVTLGAIPFFHVYGMTVAMNLSLLIGANIVLIPNPRDIKALLSAIEKSGVTLFPGVPTLYNAINNSPLTPEYDLKTVRACISGSAALPSETARKFREITGGANLVEGYGLTESSPITHTNPVGGEQREGSIGLPLPGIDASVRDDQGREVPVGEIGELWVAGPNIMAGYWQRSEATAETIVEELTEEGQVRWLKTGDMARMDEDGYFSIVDRKKELILVGGHNVYPREVEEVLYQHPAVLEAAVIGVPDTYRGEHVKAFVVLKPEHSVTPEQITAFCKQQLSAFKAPRSVEFRSELPLSAAGKVLRRVLAEEEKAKMEQATVAASAGA